MKKRVALSIAALIGGSVNTYADGGIYIVRAGDTLSTIAADWIGRPVFTPDGSLAQLLKLNPRIRSPHQIHPGEPIFLGKGNRSPRKLASVESSIPKPAATEEAEFSPVSHLGLDLGLEYFRIDSNDRSTGAKATLLSNTTPMVSLRWDLDWSESWSTRLGMTYLSESIMNTTSTTSSVEGGSGSRYEFTFGPIYRWSDRVRTGLLLGSVQRDFTHSPSASTVQIDRIQEGELLLTQEVDVFKVKTARAGLAGALSGLSGGTGPGYSTKPGWGADFAVYLKHQIGKVFEMRGEAFYGMWKQNSDLVTQQEKHLGVSLGISVRLGE